MSDNLETLIDAARAIQTNPTRSTFSRWVKKHPGIGLRIGGRQYVWREAREAINRGVTLEEAASIGMAAKERYFAARTAAALRAIAQEAKDE